MHVTDPLYRRKSFIQRGQIYFWTSTINSWYHLLRDERYKQVIVDSLEYLVGKDLIDVFAFVIMPNHIHLLWRINKMNGKEKPHVSFLKYTAHRFKKLLQNEGGELCKYAVNAINKDYEFWQRDSLAVILYTRKVMLQKLNYIHKNPLAPHWQLTKDPGHYHWSSAKFYESGNKEFSFLKNIWDEF